MLLLVSLALAEPVLDTLRLSAAAPGSTLETFEAPDAGTARARFAWDLARTIPTAGDAAFLDRRMAATAALAGWFGHGVMLEGAVPLVFGAAGWPDGLDPADSPVSVGAARFRMRVGHRPVPLVGLGAAFRLETPSQEFADDPPPVRYGPEVGLSVGDDRRWATATVGWLRTGWDAGLGAGLGFGDRAALTAELLADHPVAGSVGAEARLGGAVRTVGALWLDAGGGAGLAAAEGHPQLRVWAGARLTPTATTRRVKIRSSRVAPPVPPPPPTEVAHTGPEVDPLTLLYGDGPTVTPTAASAPPPPPPDSIPYRPFPQPLQVEVKYDGAQLGPGAELVAYSLALHLRADPKARIRLEVHMGDARGVADPFALTQERADNLRAAVIAEGIDPSRVEALGFGAGGYGGDVVDVVTFQ